MEKENVLEIEYQEVFDKVAVRIKYLNNGFFADGFCKEDIEKYNCSMENSPYDDEEYVLFLGDNIIISDKTIHCYTQEKIKEIKEFVDFVNEKHGIPKRWRAEKNKTYYLINYYGHVCDVIEENIERDNEFFEQGNYFKTLEEAEKVKKELDKFWAKVRAGEIGGDE